MKKLWLYNNNAPALIIFFNGWGMDENIITHIAAEDLDILLIQDYKTLTDVEIKNHYKKIYIIAWSFGVFVASQAFQTKPHNAISIAINGTENPIHQQFGIVPEVFKGTLENWNNINAEKFMNRIFGGNKTKNSFSSLLPLRQADEQKEELQQLQNLVLTKKSSTFTWDFSIIGMKDAIFLPDNQKKYWQGKTRLLAKDWPHAPFHLINSWKNLLQEIQHYDK